MDRELETFVEQVMAKQQYRSGIFTNWLDKILQGITDFRGAPNIRGSYGVRGGKQMDEYVDQYIENVMNQQIYRSGIEFFPSWVRRIFSRNG